MEEVLSEILKETHYPESLINLDRSEYIKFRSKTYLEKQIDIDGVNSISNYA